MRIKPVENEKEWEATRAIRRRVFIEEQDCSPEEEWDSFDETSRHVLGLVDGEAIATARWRAVPYEEEVIAKLERFAVLPEHRGKGYGRALVRYVIEDARRAGFDTFLLHAQAHLADFYSSLGFEQRGERFMEAGISHVRMVRRENIRKDRER